MIVEQHTYTSFAYLWCLAAAMLLLALSGHTAHARACAPAAAEPCCENVAEELSPDGARAAERFVDDEREGNTCASVSGAVASCEAHDDPTRACNCGDDCGEECDVCCFDASLRSMTSPAQHEAAIPSSRLLLSPVPVPLENIQPVPKLPPRV